MKIEDIKTKLKEYENAKIDYSKFLELKDNFAPQMTEKEFSKVLEISESVFHNLKYRKGAKAIILKNKNAHIESKKEILNNLDQYRNSYIDYKKFCELYKQYGKNIGKIKFAELLEISSSNLGSMRQRGTKAKILADSGREEITSKIRAQIMLNENLVNNKIDYNSFSKLYRKYGIKYKELFYKYYGREEELKEVEFAHILNISSSNYWSMVRRGIRVKTLKRDILEMGDEIKAKRKLLKSDNPNIRMVNYDQLIKLYELYGKNMDERSFATEILGIDETSYYAIKSQKGLKARIDFNRKQRKKVEGIKKENRFYSYSEIEKMAKANNITIKQFITYIFHLKEESKLVQDYEEVLESKQKLYIGNTVMSKDFLDKNAKELLDLVKTQSKIYGSKYNAMRYSDDVASEVLLILMEKYGEITNNFENEKAMEILTRIANVTTRYNYFGKFSVKQFKSLDEDGVYYNGDLKSNDKLLYEIDKNNEIEDDEYSL